MQHFSKLGRAMLVPCLVMVATFLLHVSDGKTADSKMPESETKAGASRSYKDIFGKSVQTDVAVFVAADQKHVTPAVLNGYQQYGSYCFRCHGRDAVGGGYAPDLRKSMAGGMTYQSFLSTVMTGRQNKGMPSWAGTLKENDIHAIYDYLKARQLDLIPQGRPPSG